MLIVTVTVYFRVMSWIVTLGITAVYLLFVAMGTKLGQLRQVAHFHLERLCYTESNSDGLFISAKSMVACCQEKQYFFK